MFRRIKNRPRKKLQFQKRRHMMECLESRLLMANIVWDGGGDGTSWTDARNWLGDTLPGASDDVTIDVATNPTIRIASGVQSIRSLVSNEALNITGGSLRVAGTAEVDSSVTLGSASLVGGTWDVSEGIQVTGTATLDAVTVNNDVTVQDGKSLTVQNAAVLNGKLTLGANSNLSAGAQVTLACPAVPALSNVNLTAADGAVISCDSVTTLINVNLNASSGGQILFPAAISYTGGNYADTTIQASGAGSVIDLAHLQVLAGGGSNNNYRYATHIKALAGGNVELAGTIGRNGSGAKWNDIQVSRVGSKLGVREVTNLDGTNLAVTILPSLIFEKAAVVTAASLNAGMGSKLEFPLATSLTSVSLMASDGGQIVFPATTSYTGDNYADTTTCISLAPRVRRGRIARPPAYGL